jgi:hypothetical protein
MILNKPTLLFLLASLFAMPCYWAQDGESLEPLLFQPRSEQGYNRTSFLETRNNASPTFHGTFFYVLDTVSLPLFDDFTTDKFQPFDAEQSDPNVTDEFYYALLDLADNPLPMETVYTDVPTYKIEVNVANETVDTVWFSSIAFKFNNLATYPNVVYGVYTGYPPYVLIDTLDFANPPDTLWMVDDLYRQDTARVFVVAVSAPEYCWADRYAHRNFTRAVNPWSLGVATLDGLDENGYPYAINTSFTDYADALTSKAINLNFPPADSIYFSFLFQAGGFSDMPEVGDSLILQFLNVNTQLWENIWSTGGVPLGDFKLVHLPVRQSKYLQNGFKFRFRNYGGISGDLDNWHIDYVNLRRLSGYQDTLVKDFAIVYPIPTLLKDYTAIPWKHFRNQPENRMTDSLLVVVRNGSNLPENNQPGELKIYDGTDLEWTYTFPGQTLSNGDLNYQPRTVYASEHDLGSVYQFPTSSPNDTMYTFRYEFAASAPFAQLSNANDTVRGEQHFAHYYAYDDGSAELAYGVTGAQARLAYKFEMSEPDSLVGVQMHFVPTVFNHEDKIFLLTVWADQNGRPGQVLYQDNFFNPSYPKYMHDRNLFHTYFFRDTMKVAVPQVFYVGWRQIEANRLNVGFDVNRNVQDRIFYSVDGELNWFNSSFEGALMIRPLVTSKLDYQVDLDELVMPEPLVVYPNPFRDEVNFSYVGEGNIRVYSLEGRLVKSAEWTTTMDLSDLSSGVFILNVHDLSGNVMHTEKLIKH